MSNDPIAISSGHGKYVPGAVGYLNEVDENRRVVAEVANQLRSRAVTVRGPFNDDTSHSVNENLNTTSKWHNNQDRQLDVQVHFNAHETTNKPMGTECLYISQQKLAAKVASAIADAGHLIDRGPKKRTDLHFLNATDKPAILIEVCFVDSSADTSLYKDNFKAICSAIATAISGVSPKPGRPPPEQPEAPPTSPPDPHPVLQQGDTGPAVVVVQQTLALPNDGDFGPVTDAGVSGFQRAMGLAADGIVGPATWAELDRLDALMAAGSDGISPKLAQEIDKIVDESPLLGYTWEDRGKGTPGYYAGMAKTFALAVTRLWAGNDPAVALMAMADTHNPDKDALSWYATEFRAEDMDNSRPGVDTLRHLFVLMFGLGMRESSGNHWCGRDMSAENVQSDTAEAGLMQTSWNISNAADEIEELFVEFREDPNGFQPTFGAGLAPTVGNLDNYGSGNGAYYQWLAKYCPAFAVLMTAVGLRKLRQHWGPINRKEVELVMMVDDLLIDVERAMEDLRGEV